MLGNMYQNGNGVSENMDKAIEYYTYAASKNHALSAYVLGLIYANGESVARDVVKGYAWLSVAAEQKLPAAEKARKTLENSMSLSEIERARREILTSQQQMQLAVSPVSKTALKEAMEPSKRSRSSVRRRRRL